MDTDIRMLITILVPFGLILTAAIIILINERYYLLGTLCVTVIMFFILLILSPTVFKANLDFEIAEKQITNETQALKEIYLDTKIISKNMIEINPETDSSLKLYIVACQNRLNENEDDLVFKVDETTYKEIKKGDKCYLVYKKSKGESEKARLLINEKYFNSL